MAVKMKKVLIIRMSAMGDVILALPVAMALKDHDTSITVDFLTKKEYASIFDQFPAVDTAYGYDGNVWSLIKELQKQKYDTVIDLQKNPRSLIIAAALTPKNVAGYPKRRIKREIIIRQSRFNLHAGHTVDAYFQALTRLKVKPVSRRPRVILQPEIIKFGDDFIGNTDFKNKVVGLCPGSKHAEKQWPLYQELAELIIKDDDKDVIVFSGPFDKFDPNLNIASEKLVTAYNMNLDKVAGVMNKCDLVVTNDSGLMHLAVALSVPVVAIFGPTHPSLGFAPLGDNDRVICDDVKCSPCSLHGEKKCRMPSKYCFDSITPERVKAELEHIIYAESPGEILR